MGVLKKVKASTLMETLIAMVIIVLCFTLGMLIYMNVVSSENRMQKFHANLLLKEWALKIKEQNEFIDAVTESEDITIIRKFTKYGSAENLLQLTLTAFDKKERLLSSHREIILIGQ